MHTNIAPPPPIASEIVTLRDYFAAHALNGMLAGVDKEEGIPAHIVLARNAYRFADAMMEARR